jgi:hypothetical protein
VGQGFGEEQETMMHFLGIVTALVIGALMIWQAAKTTMRVHRSRQKTKLYNEARRYSSRPYTRAEWDAAQSERSKIDDTANEQLRWQRGRDKF